MEINNISVTAELLTAHGLNFKFLLLSLFSQVWTEIDLMTLIPELTVNIPFLVFSKLWLLAQQFNRSRFFMRIAA